jgi:hypothetical protein
MLPLEFYTKNKDITWELDPVPSDLTTDLEKASWILNTSNFGWLELDIDIDVDAWKKEAVAAIPYYVPHREYDNAGWNSCCIHGISTDKTGAWVNYGYTNEPDVPYAWTELAEHTPAIKDFWQNTFPSDMYRRIRFMELQANSAITPHSDMPGKLPGEDNFDALEFGVPVNIAVIHPKDCHMILEGYGVVPFEEGKAYIINIRHQHSVINFSDQNRIHVIGHSFGYGTKKEQFAELVARSYHKQYANRT